MEVGLERRRIAWRGLIIALSSIWQACAFCSSFRPWFNSHNTCFPVLSWGLKNIHLSRAIFVPGIRSMSYCQVQMQSDMNHDPLVGEVHRATVVRYSSKSWMMAGVNSISPMSLRLYRCIRNSKKCLRKTLYFCKLSLLMVCPRALSSPLLR